MRAGTGVTPVAVHANYLINLAAADDSIREKSVASFREEVERGLQLGADYLELVAKLNGAKAEKE